MKRILFDGISTQSTKIATYHGGGEYAKYILQMALEHNYSFDIVFNKEFYMDQDIDNYLTNNTQVRIIYVKSKAEIYKLIEKNNYDVFYSALPYKYNDYKGKVTLIGVIHGLRGAEIPWEIYKYKYQSKILIRFVTWIINYLPFIQQIMKQKHLKKYRLLMEGNAKFITVSNHTKNSMLYFYPDLKAENIKVFYSPFSVRKIEKTVPKDNYYLMVSANRFEKNVYRAVRVFDKLFSDGRLADKRVVITGCGKQPFWNEIKNRKRFELLPYVSSDDLEDLYSKAFCFVYPSLNEGFGYPPLKAMAYGTPVIASSATSIPEICDDAACYFSPTNEDDLAVRLLRVDGDYEYRNILIERGIKRVQELQDIQKKEIKEELSLIFE